MQLNIRKKRKK